MSIYGDVLQMATQEQQIQSAQTANQLRTMQIAQMANAMQVAQQTRLAVRNQQLAADQVNQAVNTDSGVSNEGVGSVPTNTTGQPSDPSQAQAPSGIDANPEMQTLQKMYMQAQGKATDYSNMAAAVRRTTGDERSAQQFDSQARDQQRIAQQTQLRMLQQHKDTVQEIGGAAGNANADNFPVVKGQLDRLMPGWDKSKDVDFSPLQGGQVVWGPRTQTVLGQLANSAMTRYQQVESMHQQADEQFRQQHEANYEQEIQGRNDKRDADIEAKRQGLENQGLRLQLQEQKAAVVKTPTPKEPQFNEIKDQAAQFATDDKLGQLPAPMQRNAARDYLRYRNNVMAKGVPQDQAEAEAMQFVQGRVTPGQPGVKNPWNYLPFTDKFSTEPKAASYGPKAQTAAPAPIDISTVKSAADLKDGAIYNTKRGPAAWNAKSQMFEAK